MPVFGAGGLIPGEQIVALASRTETATGNGPQISVGQFQTLRLTLDVTAASGTTPSLTVTLQTSSDGATWVAVAAFAAATTVGTQRKAFSGLDRYARCVWTISGTTPSLTFSVTGEAL